MSCETITDLITFYATCAHMHPNAVLCLGRGRDDMVACAESLKHDAAQAYLVEFQREVMRQAPQFLLFDTFEAYADHTRRGPRMFCVGCAAIATAEGRDMTHYIYSFRGEDLYVDESKRTP